MNDATLTPLNPTRQDRVRETGAIQTRIDAAAAKGGGRVIIPKGIHPCRTLYLKSGVEHAPDIVFGSMDVTARS